MLNIGVNNGSELGESQFSKFTTNSNVSSLSMVFCIEGFCKVNENSFFIIHHKWKNLVCQEFHWMVKSSCCKNDSLGSLTWWLKITYGLALLLGLYAIPLYLPTFFQFHHYLLWKIVTPLNENVINHQKIGTWITAMGLLDQIGCLTSLEVILIL